MASVPGPGPGSPPSSVESVRFVAPSGSDKGAGTEQDPWRTLEFALEQMRAGQTLYVRGGTYDEDVEPDLARGTRTSRIVVRNAPGERAVVKGIVRLNDPDYWTVFGLEFIWGGGSYDEHMVKVSSGTGWIVDSVSIHGSRSRAGLLIAGSRVHGPPRDYTLRNSAVYDSRRASNLYLNPGLDGTGGLIEHNLFFGSPTENVKIGFGGDCRQQKNELFGAANVVFRYNTLYDGWQPMAIAEPANRIEVHGNIIGKSGRDALIRLDGTCDNLGRSIVVRDNLGFGARRWCQQYSSPVTCQQVDKGGNVFPRDPRFDSIGPGGFRPQDRLAQRYGRYAQPAGG